MTAIVVQGRFTGGALFQPKVTEEGKPASWNACLCLEPAEAAKIDAAVTAAIAEKWQGKPPPGAQNHANRVGDDPEIATYQKRFINAKRTTVTKKGLPMKPPGTFIKRNGVVTPVAYEDDIIYPGCYLALEVEVYGYDGDKARNIKPGITVSLNKALFLKDGERLSKETNPDAAFQGFESDTSASFGSDDPLAF